MEISIQKYKYEKVIIDNFKLVLPEETFYYHDYNCSVRTMVKPTFTTWNMRENNTPETLMGYDIVKVEVSDKNIYYSHLNTTDFEKYLNIDPKNLSRDERIKYDISIYIYQFFGDDKIKSEYFKEGYDKVIEYLNKLINI